MAISDLAATVAQVRCFKAGQQQGAASGFFYAEGDRLFFITNRHVIIKEEDNYYPGEIRMRLHINPNDIRQNEDLSLHLYDDSGKPTWLEHPIHGARIDVVAIDGC